MEIEQILTKTKELLGGIDSIIVNARKKVAVFLNTETILLYWSIGNYIKNEIKHESYSNYGKQILATLSQELTLKYGKGYSYSALTRMIKVATSYDVESIATVSQYLSWSHLIELAGIADTNKRLFYEQLAVIENWGVRELRQKEDTMLYERTAIAKQPQEVILQALKKQASSPVLSPDLVFKNTYILDFLGLDASFSESELEHAIMAQLERFILELGQGFAFLERQKRLGIDTTNYYLDLLFYHRKLNRLVAIDLKLGKFKPEYKAQMELYLRYLEKHEQQPHENTPIGLLLCSEGNTEHVELLMLGEENIKVAQYLTELPEKQWFQDKLHKAIAIAQQNTKQA